MFYLQNGLAFSRSNLSLLHFINGKAHSANTIVDGSIYLRQKAVAF
jgi:hypothetical protein